MQWQHDLDPRDVNQASQLGKSEKAPSKASLRSLVPHSQTLRLTTQLRQAARIWGLLTPRSITASSVTGLRLSIPFERDVFIFAVPCQFYCSAGLPFSCPGLRFVQALGATCGPPGRSTLPNRLTQTATKYGVANPCRKD